MEVQRAAYGADTHAYSIATSKLNNQHVGKSIANRKSQILSEGLRANHSPVDRLFMRKAKGQCVMTIILTQSLQGVTPDNGDYMSTIHQYTIQGADER